MSDTVNNPINEQFENNQNAAQLLENLINLAAMLRGPEGCPWDRKQTIGSMRDYIIEEAAEAAEAIENSNMDNLCEELGDLLMQIVMIAEIASETENFNMSKVISGIGKKMIRRHPHIFSGETADSAEDVVKRWKEIKKMEKASINLPS